MNLEIACLIDITAILILAVLLVQATKETGDSILDYMAACVAMFIVYAIAKAPILILFRGFKFPLDATGRQHVTASIFSFAVCAFLLARANRIKKDHLQRKNQI